MFLIVHFIIHIYIHTRIIRINTHTQDAYTSSYIYTYIYGGCPSTYIYVYAHPFWFLKQIIEENIKSQDPIRVQAPALPIPGMMNH